MTSTVARGLVGRSDILADLDAHLTRAAGGGGRFVLLSGEPGIGKTALCEDVLARARGRGFDAAWSSCWQSEAAVPLHPVAELVSQLGGDFQTLAGGDDEGEAPPDRLRRRTARACAWLRSRAADRPVLLVVDDLHWADQATAELVAAWAAAVRTAPVLGVATVRGDEVGEAAAAAVAQIRRQGDELEVGPLTDDEVGRLAERHSRGTSVDRARLARLSGGNPLYVRELLALLNRDGGHVDLRSADVPAPARVQDLVAERLRRLDGPVVDLVRDLAVLGDAAPLPTLAAVRRDSTPGDVLGGVEAAVADGFVTLSGEGTVGFAHPLHRAAVYAGLGPAEAARRHARVAAVLDGLHREGAAVPAAVLAHHYGRSAAPGHTAEALRWSLAAGRAARQVMAEAAAVGHFEAALAILDRSPTTGSRAQVLLELGEARRAANDSAGARIALDEAVDAARQEPGRPRLAAAVLARTGGDGFEVPIADARLVALLDEAVAGTDAADAATLARLLARRSVAASYERSTDERAADANRAAELAAAAGDDAARGLALAAQADVVAGPEHVEERLALAAEIVALARRARVRRLELLGRRFLVVALMEDGALARAGLEVAAYQQAAAGLDPRVRWCGPLWRAALAMARGDEAARQAGVEELAALVEEGAGGNARLLLLVHQVIVAMEAGDGSALEHFTAMASGPDTGMVGLQAVVAHIFLLLVAGHDREAAALLAANRDGIDAMARDAEWLSAACQVADIALRTGDADLARWAFDALAPHARRWAVEGIGAALRGPVSRWLAPLARLLGDDEAASAHLAAARLACEQAGASFVASLLEPAATAGTGAGPSGVGPRLRRAGDGWELTFGGRTVTLRHRKGLADLATLLAAAGREVAALDLAGDAGPGRPPVQSGLDALDSEARRAYQARIRDIEAELDEADRDADTARSAMLAAERDALVAELAGAYGLGGRARRAGSTAERARTAVTARVRDALRRIAEVHPEAGRHLERSVRTGTFCVYDPEPAVRWEVDPGVGG